MSSDEEISIEGGMFEEPEDFRPPKPEAHFAKYERKFSSIESEHNIKEINLRLVGKSPLWGHLLWNAGVYTGNFIDKNGSKYIKDKKIVEYGAASALPSLLCSLNEAELVVCTDYPDLDLLNNIKFNIDSLGYEKAKENIEVLGFIWGNDTNEIKERLKGKDEDGFADFQIMSDLVFNHSEHHKLLKSCKELIRPLKNGVPRSGGKCLVVWSPHRPKKEMVENDFKFFEDAKDIFNFDVEFIEMVHWPNPMFPEDPKESEELRSRVYCYMLHPSW